MTKLFRLIGLSEAISFLLLLFIAMPLKYVWDYPQAVSIVGMAHGILFMGYVLLAFNLSAARYWSRGKLIMALVAAVLPFGPLIFDRKYLGASAG